MSKMENVLNEAKKDKRANQGCLYAFNKAVNGTLERAFDSLGRFVGRRPVLVIIVSLIVVAGLGSGLAQLENEDRGEKLWVPDDNESQRRNDFVDDNFPTEGRLETVQIRRADGGSMMNPAAFDKFLQVHNGILNVTWNNNGDDKNLPDQVRFTTLCLNENSQEGAADFRDCDITSPIEVFSYDPSSWASTADILATFNDPSLWDQDLAGQGFVPTRVLGNAQIDESGQITDATVLAGYYMLAGNETLHEQQKRDKPARAWEERFLDFLEAEDEADGEYLISRFAGRSFDDEFGGTINDDLRLLQVAIVAVLLFTMFALSNCKDGFVGRRMGLTWAGLINVGLAVVASYGFCSYIGLFFTPLMSILPFIMLGVGVDGMFVLSTALDGTDMELPLPERMAQTMQHGGVSVFVASLTNFGAFMIGSNTSLPALSTFSIYAAFGLLFNLILQVTFFAGCLALDAKRQTARRVDVCCCIESSRPTGAGMCGGYLIPGFPKYRFSTSLMTWLGRQYSKLPVRIAVVVAWLAILGAGIYGTSQMRVDADVNDFIPAGSYLKDWLEVRENYFTSSGTAVDLYWVSTEELPIDFTSPQIQEQMDLSLNLYRENKFVVAGTMNSWWDAFRGSLNGTVNQATFYQDLETFMETSAGQQYTGQIRYNEEGNVQSGIRTCRSAFRWKYLEDTQDQIDALDSARETAKQIPAPLGTNAFPFSEDFLDIEQYKTIGREALMNIGLGFAMIAIVVMLLVANPVAAILTFISVASAIIELVGFMYFRGTYIDSVTVIFLVISLGLAVDYSVHVANGYLATRVADPVERLEHTMATTGAAVINGAISTLIAALCLSASGSYVFIVFFYSLLFIVLCGAFQGLVVLPVLLDIARPSAHADVNTHEDNSDDLTDPNKVDAV